MFYRKKLKKRYYVFLSILIVTPIICNFLIGTQRFSNLPVIGDEVVWLQFFGNYIGSAITTIGALWICIKTIDDARHCQSVELIHTEAVQLKYDLAKRFGCYHPDELLNLKLESQIPNNEDCVKEINRLFVLKGKYEEMLWSGRFLYAVDKKSKDLLNVVFLSEYEDLLNKTLDVIEQQINIYHSINQMSLDDYKTKTECFYKQIVDLNVRKEKVFKYAMEYFISLKYELNKQQESD